MSDDKFSAQERKCARRRVDSRLHIQTRHIARQPSNLSPHEMKQNLVVLPIRSGVTSGFRIAWKIKLKYS